MHRSKRQPISRFAYSLKSSVSLCVLMVMTVNADYVLAGWQNLLHTFAVVIS